jgi:hypothetical protein
MLFESFARVNTGTFIFNWVRKGQTTVVSMKRLLFLVDAWMGACLFYFCALPGSTAGFAAMVVDVKPPDF